MRVLIDTTALGRGPSGTATYLRGLLSGLGELGVDVVEAADVQRRRGSPNGGRRSALGVARSARNLAAGAAWTHQGLATAVREAGADVLHHPLPARSRLAGVPQVVTVQDLAFERLPWAFDPAWRRIARVTHRRAAHRADAVVCISEATARDVRALWGLEGEGITVAHLAAAAPEGGTERSEPADDADPGGWLLYVGDAEPRKNLPTLLEAWRRHRAVSGRSGSPALDLVLAGGAARAAADEPGLRMHPAPDPEELEGLWRGARALVHPALHEGFGLTPLEALARGVPVLAGRIPAVLEVCGEAAAYFDPRDPAELAARLNELAGDPTIGLDRAAEGRRRARTFSWRRCAEHHLHAYRTALGVRR